MDNKSFLGNLTISKKILVHLAFISSIVIIQMLLSNYKENNINHKFSVLIAQKNQLFESREVLSNKILEIKFLKRYYNLESQFGNLSDVEQELGVLLKEIETIIGNVFLSFDNHIGQQAVSIMSTVQTIKSLLLNISNSKDKANRDKSTSGKISLNYGIDNILNKIKNKNLISLYSDIVKAENEFITSGKDAEFAKVISAYNAFKDTIKAEPVEPKLQEDLITRITSRYDHFKYAVYSSIDFKDITEKLSSNVTILIQLDKELQGIIEEFTTNSLSGIEKLKNRLDFIIDIFHIVSIFAVILVYFTIKHSVIYPLEQICETALELANGNIAYIPYLKNKDEIGQVAKVLKLFEETEKAKEKIEIKLQTMKNKVEEVKKINIQDITLKVKEYLQIIVQDITNDSHELFYQSENVNLSLDTTINIMEQMVNTLKTVTKVIQNPMLSTKELKAIIKDVADKSANSASRFIDIKTNAENVKLGINNLGQSASKIDQSLKLITDTIEQVNLLILNTKIESMRTKDKNIPYITNELKDLTHKIAKVVSEGYKELESIRNTAKVVTDNLNYIQSSIKITHEDTDNLALDIQNYANLSIEFMDSLHNAAYSIINIKNNISMASKTVEAVKTNSNELLGGAKSLKDKASSLENSVKEFFSELVA